MHDPKRIAFQFYLGKRKRKDGTYRNPFLTIWHIDPETDGTDDSSGWFLRARHGDKEMLQRITNAIKYNFNNKITIRDREFFTGYFNPNTGQPNYSVQGITLNMFSVAAWEFFYHNRKKQRKWMTRNLYDIMFFAENPNDSLRDVFLGAFRNNEEWNKEDDINHYASVIYGWLLRDTRKWWKHPKWQIHRWSLQFHPFQYLKRYYWDKCVVCGKRGFKNQSAMSDWHGTKIWHQECDRSFNKTPKKEN